MKDGDMGMLTRAIQAAVNGQAISSSVISDATPLGRSILAAVSAAAIKTILQIQTTDIVDSGATGRQLVRAKNLSELKSIIQTVAADITDATALGKMVLTATSLSGAMDASFGTTRGTVVVRGASGWNSVSTSNVGYTLQWNGTDLVFAPPSSGAINVSSQPGGRLTLASGSPASTAIVSAAGTLYYTPYIGNYVPVWNGSIFVPTVFSELSNVLSDAAANPAAAVANSIYDLFVWSDTGGSLKLVRGPTWTNLTTRAMSLSRVNGYLVNSAAITNGPGIGYGTYVGTIATDSSGATVTFNLGSAASGGGAAIIGLWNAFNRVDAAPAVVETTAPWTYSSATIRPVNGSNSNRISLVRGLDEDGVKVSYASVALATYANQQAAIFVGLDSTSAGAASGKSGKYFNVSSAQSFAQMEASYSGNPGVGAHYFQALENVPGAGGTVTFGDTGGQTMLSASIRY